MDNEALKFFESHIDDIDKIGKHPRLLIWQKMKVMMMMMIIMLKFLLRRSYMMWIYFSKTEATKFEGRLKT